MTVSSGAVLLPGAAWVDDEVHQQCRGAVRLLIMQDCSLSRGVRSSVHRRRQARRAARRAVTRRAW